MFNDLFALRLWPLSGPPCLSLIHLVALMAFTALLVCLLCLWDKSKIDLNWVRFKWDRFLGSFWGRFIYPIFLVFYSMLYYRMAFWLYFWLWFWPWWLFSWLWLWPLAASDVPWPPPVAFPSSGYPAVGLTPPVAASDGPSSPPAASCAVEASWLPGCLSAVRCVASPASSGLLRCWGPLSDGPSWPDGCRCLSSAASPDGRCRLPLSFLSLVASQCDSHLWNKCIIINSCPSILVLTSSVISVLSFFLGSF